MQRGDESCKMDEDTSLVNIFFVLLNEACPVIIAVIYNEVSTLCLNLISEKPILRILASCLLCISLYLVINIWVYIWHLHRYEELPLLCEIMSFQYLNFILAIITLESVRQHVENVMLFAFGCWPALSFMVGLAITIRAYFGTRNSKMRNDNVEYEEIGDSNDNVEYEEIEDSEDDNNDRSPFQSYQDTMTNMDIQSASYALAFVLKLWIRYVTFQQEGGPDFNKFDDNTASSNVSYLMNKKNTKNHSNPKNDHDKPEGGQIWIFLLTFVLILAAGNIVRRASSRLSSLLKRFDVNGVLQASLQILTQAFLFLPAFIFVEIMFQIADSLSISHSFVSLSGSILVTLFALLYIRGSIRNLKNKIKQGWLSEYDDNPSPNKDMRNPEDVKANAPNKRRNRFGKKPKTVDIARKKIGRILLYITIMALAVGLAWDHSIDCILDNLELRNQIDKIVLYSLLASATTCIFLLYQHFFPTRAMQNVEHLIPLQISEFVN